MSDAESAPSPYRASVEAIETAYEFMLAYAAQGRDREGAGGDGAPIRRHLEALRDGLGVLADQARAEAEAIPGGADAPAFAAFLEVVKADAAVAKTKVEVALTVPSIGSPLVDNLNASIHLRALLTDIFLLDEYLKGMRRGA